MKTIIAPITVPSQPNGTFYKAETLGDAMKNY